MKNKELINDCINDIKKEIKLIKINLKKHNFYYEKTFYLKSRITIQIIYKKHVYFLRIEIENYYINLKTVIKRKYKSFNNLIKDIYNSINFAINLLGENNEKRH